MAERHIGVALDFSPCSKYALQWAIKNIVKDCDHLVIVVVNKKQQYESGEVQLWEDTGSPLIPLSDFGNPALAKKYGVNHDIELFSSLEDEAHQKQLVVVFKLYWGDPREKLCDAVVDLPLDCIVMGSRGLGTLKRALLGSVSNYVVNNAPCPVTVVKQPSEIIS